MHRRHDQLKTKLHRKKYTQVCCLLACLAWMHPGQAQIYKQQQTDGSVVFTDQPNKNQTKEKIELSPTIIVPSIKTNNTTKSQAQPETIAYKLSLQSPKDGANFRNSEADAIPLALGVKPAIRPPNRIKIQVNGQTIDTNRKTLPRLNRGEHVIQASLINQAGKVLSSTSSTIFVHRFSVKN